MKRKAIAEIVGPFVDNMRGRYAEYVSDEFLKYLLTEQIFQAARGKLLTQVAYDIGARIFETILEGDLKAGGNGHHVAQELSKAFENFKID